MDFLNRSFIGGCLIGAAAGMLAAWLISFVDIEVSLRDTPGINLSPEVVHKKEEVKLSSLEIVIPEEEEESDYEMGTLVNKDWLDSLSEKMRSGERVILRLIADHSSEECPN